MDTELFTLTPESINYLSTARKWALFLSIIGFIGVIFLVLMGIFIGFIFNLVALPQDFAMAASAFSVVASIFYIIIAIIAFIPVWFLFQFSRKVKKALLFEDENILADSLRNLKNYFVYYGILTILAIVFYVIIFIISLFTAVGTMNGLAV